MVLLCGAAELAPSELLRQALQRYCGLDQLPPMARKPGGKPWFPSRPELHFNLSHSGSLVLCAVGDAPLGVDVERIRPRRSTLPRYTLGEAEFAWFDGRGALWPDFYTLWTLKEARCKQSGRGLDRPAAAIPVPAPIPEEGCVWDGLSFRSYGGTLWRGALCAPAGTPLPEQVLWLTTPPA